jgi:transcriptional regulator with XRE-family HTH domain
VQALEISQRQLADRLGLSEARVSRILNGAENTTLRTIADLGWAFGVRFSLVPVPFETREDTPASDDGNFPEWVEEQRRLASSRSVAPGPSPIHCTPE